MLRLLVHPDSPPSPIREVQVAAARLTDGRLSLVYMAVGDVARIRVPGPARPERTDGLWRRTCFEAFVAPPDGETYFELNLAPSGQWAAYRLDCYRGGMTEAPVDPPLIECVGQGVSLGLVAGIALGPLPELVPWQTWRLGLAAVIEAEDGSLSHWALAHRPGPPDFHHRDCFAAELPPAACL